jgi:cytoskeleton protein RodZ
MAQTPEDASRADMAANAVLSAPETMRRAREAAGLSLEDVSARTRVTLRHLKALEAGDYQELPGTTYCAGFARAYARAVGIDETALVAKIRSEIDELGQDDSGPYAIEEPVDPSSVPPRKLVLAATIVAVLLAGGYAIWRTQYTAAPTDEQVAVETRTETRIADPRGAPPASGAAPAPAPVPTGPVVMTAVNEVWLRIYEPSGKRLFEGTLAKDKSVTVPSDAENPMILTGRPDALAVTVGGQAIPPLGTAERTISDVPVSAAALLARGTPTPQGEGDTAEPSTSADRGTGG